MPRTHAPLALLVALTLALTGCGGVDKRAAKAGLNPSPTAAFASEEEALAAAVDAYDRFRSLGDEIGREGGRDAERLSEVAAGEFLKQSVEGFDDWEEEGWHQVGTSAFRDATLQQFSDGPSAAVTVYLCHDVSDVQVLDMDGRSIVDSDRPDTNYLEVTFDLGEDGLLRVSDRERWDERAC